MRTKPGELPPHGTTARYRRKCKCDDCRAAFSRYERELRAEDRPRLVSTSGAVKHMRRLMASGVSVRQIGIISGVCHSVLHDILGGRQSRIHRSTQERILVVTQDDVGGRATVPSWRTQRLVSEMRRAGIVNGQLAGFLRHKEVRGLSHIVGPDFCERRTQDRITTIYRYLAGQGVVPASVLKEIA